MIGRRGEQAGDRSTVVRDHRRIERARAAVTRRRAVLDLRIRRFIGRPRDGRPAGRHARRSHGSNGTNTSLLNFREANLPLSQSRSRIDQVGSAHKRNPIRSFL